MNEPGDIMLNEISPSQKGKYCIIQLIWGIWSNQTYKTENSSCQGLEGEGNGHCCSKGIEFSHTDEKVPRDGLYNNVHAVTKLYCTCINCFLKMHIVGLISHRLITLYRFTFSVKLQAPLSVAYWSHPLMSSWHLTSLIRNHI